MPPKNLNALIDARTENDRRAWLRAHRKIADARLARRLKDVCQTAWSASPNRTQKAALALKSLRRFNPIDEIEAYFLWGAGIAELTRGRLVEAEKSLAAAAAIFRRVGQRHEAAQTAVAKLIALALLGKYREAIKCGEAALAVFEEYGDELAAGKIEKNLGNIVARQGKETAAEKYYLAARRRFVKIGNLTELAMSDNSLANTYAELNDFHRAEKFFALALENARREKMLVTVAEIEASLGNLAFFRGRLDEALRRLELSRRKYEELKMPHQTAIAELEIADIYLELNLTNEAAAIYARAANALKRLKLQGEEARARANLGKTALLGNDFQKARTELEKAARLFAREKNPNGAAQVKLTEAALAVARRNYQIALRHVREAEKLLTRSENRRPKLFARWLHGEALRLLGKNKTAERILAETCAQSLADEQSNLAQMCLNSLGKLALGKDRRRSESYFKKAVRLIEKLRAPLPAEEFRMSFFADKLAPYRNLAKIYVGENECEKAFIAIERARARTLSEILSGGDSAVKIDGPAKPSKRLESLREELNWFYNRLNRAEAGEPAKLLREIKKLEKQIAALMRQLESTRRETGGNAGAAAARFLETAEDVEALRKRLGAGRALVEFVKFDGSFSAFVVTGEKIEYFAELAKESEILALLEGLRFQFGALRYGAESLGAALGELKARADFYLTKLYEKLVRPLADALEARDLTIVPAGALHYVPFHALKNERYLIETREVVYAPSATVWQFLHRKGASRKREKALLVGFADEKVPLVNGEIAALREIFPAAKILTGEDASFSNYTLNAPRFDILHLACHGQFRPDNPLFSNLRLADGFVTVRDVCAQKLRAEIVTLSACETGLNEIYAGDEILGLARGFFAAGAKSLVLSLWTVNDAATSELMRDFYTNLQRGGNVSASLRAAQLNFVKREAHPYFWSPFALFGK
ncbi:MAG TPA: CHAT domain-containing tetratricopeptide repeat protein [Pyrinomonadaceae bacterium]|jgi:tetratricopeptide (TPR) repeat protein